METVFFTFPKATHLHNYPKGTQVACWAIACKKVVVLPQGKYWLYWDGKGFKGGIFCCDLCALNVMPIKAMNRA